MFQTTLTTNLEQPSLQLDVVLDTHGETINALSGEIGVPNGLRLRNIEAADGVVDLWIVEPAIREKGVLHFAGIMPNGYSGIYGPYQQLPNTEVVFRVTFDILDIKDAQLDVRAAEALLHDGSGTPALVNIQSNSSYTNITQANREVGSGRKTVQRNAILIGVILAACYITWRHRHQ